MEQKDSAPLTAGEPSPQEIHQTRLEMVTQRIHEKEDSYKAYNFTQLQSISLNIFFDLTQEFADIEDVYAVCVMIPQKLFNLGCTLHVLDSQRGVVSCSSTACPFQGRDVRFVNTTTVEDDRLFIPIKGNSALVSELPFPVQDDIIGMLEISPADGLTEHDRLFWGRYANRIGYHLHNRFISSKNEEHVQFIRNMIKDIGHNVIVPNMYFKLFYRRLESRIEMIPRIVGTLENIVSQPKLRNEDRQSLDTISQNMSQAYAAIKEQYKEIYSHYQNTSLFLETLLRSSHFEKGRYVLERHTCNFKSQVIDPQVERYRPQFEERGIEIDTSMGGVPDQEVEVVVDVGLISQVYANLFSNVAKYAREVDEGFGRARKFMSYGWEIVRGYFGPGLDGIKLNVFSSGPPLTQEERERLFSEGYRAGNAQGEHGTGHGLYFIREVVGLHGGETGYEPTPRGNNFYFVLPFGPEKT